MDPDGLRSSIALITGAASGFGEAMAMRFAGRGARVAVADIDEAAAHRCALQIINAGGQAFALACDVAQGDSVQEAIQAVCEHWGGFNILINNAAVSQKPARLDRTPEEQVNRLLAVNIKSLYHMAVHAVPVLKSAGGGSIINIASVTGLRPRPGMTWYNATKAAVVSLTQSMAVELAPDKIRVNAIAPAAARTAMLEEMFGERLQAGVESVLSTIPLGRLCEPADVAAAALFLASPAADFITGVTLAVDGGRLAG